MVKVGGTILDIVPSKQLNILVINIFLYTFVLLIMYVTVLWLF